MRRLVWMAAGPALLAVMLAQAGCAGASRPAAAATTTVAPLATATPGGPTATLWPAGPGAWQTATACQSEPPSYRAVYAASLGPSGQGPATLQRSSDCGATWTALTPPALAGVDYSTNVTLFSVLASPLDTQVAFLTIQTTGGASLPQCATPLGQEPTIHGAIDAMPASGSICILQFVSSDGGSTWRPITLPVHGALGILSPEMNAEMGLLGPLRAQGSRLYGAVTNSVPGIGGVTPPGRLVASDDGGLTWTIADGALAAQGLAVWDFAPAPSGSMVYVTAEPVNDPARQPPTYGATLSIWASPDGGVTWRRESQAPGSASGRLVAGMVAGVTPAGQRALYLMTAGQTKQDTAMAALGSLNDGATWQGDPGLSFLPPTPGMLGYPNLVGALPDGSVVVINPYGAMPVMAWTPGSPPRAVAAPTSLFPYQNPVFVQQGATVTMWLQGEQGGPQFLTTYTQLAL